MGSCHAEVGGLGRGGNGWGRVLEGKGPGRRWGRTGEVDGMYTWEGEGLGGGGLTLGFISDICLTSF